MAKEMVEKNKIQKEVEIVGEIQRSLLFSKNKETSTPGIIILISKSIFQQKLSHIDFYNFSDLGDGKYGFGVADVSGKN